MAALSTLGSLLIKHTGILIGRDFEGFALNFLF